MIPYFVDKSVIVNNDTDKLTTWGDGTLVFALDTGKYYLLYNKTYYLIGSGVFLKIDQTTPETVLNGSPAFEEGLTINEDKRLYLDGL